MTTPFRRGIAAPTRRSRRRGWANSPSGSRRRSRRWTRCWSSAIPRAPISRSRCWPTWSARGGCLRRGPVLSLLTLGQVVPMVSFLPRAGRLRADLALMSETGRVAWVDVTAPGRWLRLRAVRSGGGLGRRGAGQTLAAGPVGGLHPDPVGGRAGARCDGGSSSGISSISTPSTTAGRSGAYDYFAVTAGPRTLPRALRPAPSASRIETAVSRYTDLAA
jgi:hypothetical protein